MPVPDKTASSMPTTFSPGQVPDLPQVVPSLLEVDGMQDQNERWQDWWFGVKQQLFKTEQNNGILLRQGAISVIEEATARETSDGFLEGKYTLTVQAGDVVTGMEITSSTSPNAGTVSQVSFRADKFQIYSGTANKIIFVADAIQNKVRMGDVFTVDSASQSIYIKTTAGAGSYANSNTPFYADNSGQFSMGSRLTWNGTTLTIGLAVVDSGGSIVLGTSNDVLILSTATDPYRIWAGNATAGSASFSVTKTGQLFSTSGTIGGFTISSTSLSATSGGDVVTLNSTSGGFLEFQGTGASNSMFAIEGMSVQNAAGNDAVMVRSDTGSATYGIINIFDGSSGTPTIICSGNTGNVQAASFTGSGSGLSSLNASNLTSGTVATARLGGGAASGATFLRGDQNWAGITSGNVSGLAASATTDTTNASNISSGTLNNSRLSFSSTPTGDVAINGYVSVGGVKLATVA